MMSDDGRMDEVSFGVVEGVEIPLRAAGRINERFGQE